MLPPGQQESRSTLGKHTTNTGPPSLPSELPPDQSQARKPATQCYQPAGPLRPYQPKEYTTRFSRQPPQTFTPIRTRPPPTSELPNQNQDDLPPTFTNPPSIKTKTNPNFNSQNFQTPTKLQRKGPKSPPKKTPQQKRKLVEIFNEENLPPQKNLPRPAAYLGSPKLKRKF